MKTARTARRINVTPCSICPGRCMFVSSGSFTLFAAELRSICHIALQNIFACLLGGGAGVKIVSNRVATTISTMSVLGKINSPAQAREGPQAAADRHHLAQHPPQIAPFRFLSAHSGM